MQLILNGVHPISSWTVTHLGRVPLYTKSNISSAPQVFNTDDDANDNINLGYLEKTLPNTSVGQGCRGGGLFVFEVGYHPRKKIQVIRVFQDQAMYARTLFRGAKPYKLEKGVFLVILTNFG